MALTNGVAKKKVFERYNFHCFDTIYFLKSEVRISFNFVLQGTSKQIQIQDIYLYLIL
jgi:hypothetical protein